MDKEEFDYRVALAFLDVCSVFTMCLAGSLMSEDTFQAVSRASLNRLRDQGTPRDVIADIELRLQDLAAGNREPGSAKG